jgi:hypothetical protein
MRSVRIAAIASALILMGSGMPALAQGTKPPAPTRKAPVKPVPKKPVAPPAAAAPAPPPAPVAPTDVRFKTTYTNGEQVTESVSFIKDQRERYELGDVILIRQRDQKRAIQISRAANTYVVTADGTPAPAAIAAPRPPGVVMVTVSIVDTGERKDAFGQTARRVRTLIEREPQPGACDQTKLRTDTDAWYIDLPKVMAATPDTIAAPASGSGCLDEIKTSESGDPKLLGFPISYRTTLTDLSDKESKPSEAGMDVTEFEVVKLDASLFDVPAGLTAASDPGAFTKSISDANEAALASASAAAVPAKKAGALRVGVPEASNKTTQTVDTRALRSRFIRELEEQKIEAIPMAAAPPAALDARAKELGVDYLLMTEITELKVSKPGGLTRVMKATAKEETRDITEAKVSVQLVPPGGKPRLSKNASGKDGGVGFKTTLGVAKFAGALYLKYYLGGMTGGQMSALSQLRMMNLGGMGSLGSTMPMGMGMGGGSADRTIGAATFIMQQVMAGAAAGAAAQGGPSFDAALENAVGDAGQDVVESIKRLSAARK